MTRIYKLVSRREWQAAKASGAFLGAAVDLADGYIHFSTGAQAVETAFFALGIVVEVHRSFVAFEIAEGFLVGGGDGLR